MIIKRDVFPAIVTFGSSVSDHTTQISNARVVQTSDRIIIAQDTPRGPVVIFSEPFEAVPTWNGKEGTFSVASTGTTVHYKKDPSCGCGSRLRSWNPYGSIVSSSQDPTE